MGRCSVAVMMAPLVCGSSGCSSSSWCSSRFGVLAWGLGHPAIAGWQRCAEGISSRKTAREFFRGHGAVKAAVKRNVQIRWNKGRSWAVGRCFASRGEVLLEGYSVVDARGWRVQEVV